MGHRSFEELSLQKTVLDLIYNKGFVEPSEIQCEAIPVALNGGDIVASAPTGSGKTEAYIIPIIDKVLHSLESCKRGCAYNLIIVPTRELATQVYNRVAEFTVGVPVKYALFHGGISLQENIKSIKRGVHIAVATPAAICELIAEKEITFRKTETLVLDEVDMLLNLGFTYDIQNIVGHLPVNRQTCCYSATLSLKSKKLTSMVTQSPKVIDLSLYTNDDPMGSITHKVLFLDKNKKRKTLLWLLQDTHYKKVIIFTQTKITCEKIFALLEQAELPVAMLHGDKGHTSRKEAMEQFNRGVVSILIATNILSRGVDVSDVTHIINFDMPQNQDTLIHRAGRTGRMGAKGINFLLCDQTEKIYFNTIMQSLPMLVFETMPYHPYHDDKVEHLTAENLPEHYVEKRKERSSAQKVQKQEKQKESDTLKERPAKSKKSEKTKKTTKPKKALPPWKDKSKAQKKRKQKFTPRKRD